jgi:hypothetical protein
MPRSGRRRRAATWPVWPEPSEASAGSRRRSPVWTRPSRRRTRRRHELLRRRLPARNRSPSRRSHGGRLAAVRTSAVRPSGARPTLAGIGGRPSIGHGTRSGYASIAPTSCVAWAASSTRSRPGSRWPADRVGRQSSPRSSRPSSASIGWRTRAGRWRPSSAGSTSRIDDAGWGCPTPTSRRTYATAGGDCAAGPLARGAGLSDRVRPQARQDRRLAVGPDQVAPSLVRPASRILEDRLLDHTPVDGDGTARVEAAS